MRFEDKLMKTLVAISAVVMLPYILLGAVALLPLYGTYKVAQWLSRR